MTRVTIQQPVLPAYRLPVFQELAGRKGIDLKVVYGDRSNSPTSVEGGAFEYECVHMSEIKMLGRTFLWHKPQLAYATPKKTDVLILSWDIHYLSLIPALMRAKTNNVKTILWGHGYSKNESKLRQRIRDRVGKLADAVMLYDRTTADRLIRRGFKSDKVFVAPNAIDQQPIQSARQHWLDHPQELAAFKKEHDLDSGPMVLFVSRLEPANRVDMLVQALPNLTKRFPKICVVVIGNGEEEIQKLKAMAPEAINEGRLRFLGPIYGETDLAPWFMSANVFCYPANIGLSVLHAFGYGLPAITSDRTESQNPEIVCLQPGENGLTYQDNSVESLTETIAKLLEDGALQQSMSDYAHQTAVERYSLSNMVNGIQAAIEGNSG